MRVLILDTALCVALSVFGTAIAADARKTITTFDPPGSIDTGPESINASGTVTGSFEDASGIWHGFLRSADGTITTFDPSGSIATNPWSINKAGSVAGFYMLGPNSLQAFLRAPDGTITTFSANARAAITRALSINDKGSVAGDWQRSSKGKSHGFVRTSDGRIKSFEVTRSTFADSMNASGAIAGDYLVSRDHYDGFLRAPDGTITTFEVPGATMTGVSSINAPGAIVGVYYGSHSSGCYLYNAGLFTYLNPPNSSVCFAESINRHGVVVGYYQGIHNNLERSYLYHPDGTFTSFTVNNNNTSAYSISDTGWITGGYYSSGMNHGFVRSP